MKKEELMEVSGGWGWVLRALRFGAGLVSSYYAYEQFSSLGEVGGRNHRRHYGATGVGCE